MAKDSGELPVKKIKATEMSSVRKDSVLKPIWGERQLSED